MTETIIDREQLLPNGFQAQIDPQCIVSEDHGHIVGGSPTRMLKLSPVARELVGADGRLVVRDRQSALLVRRLLRAGVAQPRPMFGPGSESVTVVIPVRDNQSGIDRLLPRLHGLSVIVVDDGSEVPIVAPGATVVRRETSGGPAAARNAGAAQATTDFIAFLDSDVVPDRDWLLPLLSHFSDPEVGMVAPRIVPLETRGGTVTRYEGLCSSLDMGRREGPVVPGTRISYVPSAAIIVRRSAFDGFDEDMQVAEDVDMCWRLVRAGWSVRYEPIAAVAHEHRARLASALNRRRYYGTGAALLSGRHPEVGAPLVLTVPMAVAMAALATRTRIGAAIAVIIMLARGRRLHQRVGEMPDAVATATRLTAQSFGFGLAQTASALCRHYWPISIVLALLSKRFRLMLLIAAVADGLVEWVRRELLNPEPVERVGLWRFLLLKRLDDLAYGTGLWQGVAVERQVTALKPVIGARGAAVATSTR